VGAQYHADPILRPPRFALAAKISGIIPAITGRRSSKFRAHFVPLVTFQNIERFPPMPRLAIGFADKLGGQVRLSLSLSSLYLFLLCIFIRAGGAVKVPPLRRAAAGSSGLQP
jgi:hypothetical protein